MRCQALDCIGGYIGAAIALTLLVCGSPTISDAQSPKSESGSAVSPSSGPPSASGIEQATIATDRPRIDLEFHFNENLSDATAESVPAIATLARALSSQALRESTFMIACHTSASRNPAIDQALSERCADTVRRVLIEKFGLAGETLTAVGYGSTKLKNRANPSSDENQRLEIVNMSTK